MLFIDSIQKKSTFDKLRVVFNNAYRPKKCSHSAIAMQHTLVLVFLTLKQLLQNLHMDLHND